jgi:phospholipid transport system transporter-binding protein
MMACETAPAQGGFVAEEGGWRFDGALTLDNAARVMADAQARPLPALVDFGGLARADSSALALVMALRRRAVAEGHALAVRNLPATLISLARAYGVEELVRGTA